MKQNDLSDAQVIALLIESGVASKRDVLALLMYIREELPNGMVKDLAHFVAHSSRDRGYTFERIEQFADKMIRFVQQGGMLNIEPIFEANTLTKELSRELGKLGIPLKRSATYRNREQLFAALEELLDGVSIELKNPNIYSCTFKRLLPSDPDTFCFVVEFTRPPIGGIDLPEGVGVGFPLFSPLPSVDSTE